MDAEEAELRGLKFKDVKDDFFHLLNKVYLVAFREDDDKKQIEKGQPSLDVEDTGIQYKNDA